MTMLGIGVASQKYGESALVCQKARNLGNVHWCIGNINIYLETKREILSLGTIYQSYLTFS